MKRSLCFLLCTVMLAVSLFCGCSSEKKLDPDNPVTLTFWHVYGSQTESPMNEMTDKFNETVGRDKGIIINVTSVSDSSSIDAELAAAANAEPGAAEMPDIFCAYPRVAQLLDNIELLNWFDCIPSVEFNDFVPDFLDEGRIDDKLIVFPIAKSTELAFVDTTLYNDYCASAGTEPTAFDNFDDIFSACIGYYGSTGKDLLQFDDLYNYMLTAVTSLGGSFIVDGKVDTQSKEFYCAYSSLACAAIAGGLSVGEGYASDKWKTADVLSCIGSSAAVMYLSDKVTYQDNTVREIETDVCAYPSFPGASPCVMQRGVGLLARKSEDERINAAAAEFARWLTEPGNNMDFAVKAGYLPVKQEAMKELFDTVDSIENAKYRKLYEAVADMYGDYRFCCAPLFENSSEVKGEFEKSLRRLLSEGREEYVKLCETGEGGLAAAQIIANKMLAKLTDLSD